LTSGLPFVAEHAFVVITPNHRVALASSAVPLTVK